MQTLHSRQCFVFQVLNKGLETSILDMVIALASKVVAPTERVKSKI